MHRLLLSAILLFQAPALSPSGTGVITGRLLSVDGTPAAGIPIVLVDVSAPPDARPVATDQTDRTGTYQLESIPPGRYHVVAGPADSLSYFPGSPRSTEATTLSIAAGTRLKMSDFTYLRSSGIVRVIRTTSITGAGRYTGTIRDAKGSPLPNTTVILSTLQANARFMTSTDRSGEFEFSGLPTGLMRLVALTPVQSGINGQGYELLRSTITMLPNENLQEEIRLRPVLESAAAQQPDLYAPAIVRRPPIGAPQRLGTGLTPLHGIIEKPRPAYPQNAKDAHVESDVTLQAVVGIDGKIVSLRMMSPDTNSDLARAAVETVSRWRFHPSTILSTGETVEMFGTITVRFPHN